MKKNLKNEKENLLKEQYPDLTATDKKYREVCIREYYKQYFIRFPQLYNFILVMIIVLMGVMIGCYFSGNFTGVLLTLALYISLSSILQFLTPSIAKQQDFWVDYLAKHPDNPLKVILFPMEKSIRIEKQLKLRAICSFLMVICILFMVRIIFIYGYTPLF